MAAINELIETRTPGGKIKDEYDLPPISEELDVERETGANVDFSRMDTKSVVIGGQTVTILIDKASLSSAQISHALTKIQYSFNNINNNYNEMGPLHRSYIDSVDKIIITGQVSRSFSMESSNTFVVKYGELYNSSAAFFSSNILHDGGHIAGYHQSGGSLFASRGVEADKALVQMQSTQPIFSTLVLTKGSIWRIT